MWLTWAIALPAALAAASTSSVLQTLYNNDDRQGIIELMEATGLFFLQGQFNSQRISAQTLLDVAALTDCLECFPAITITGGDELQAKAMHAHALSYARRGKAANPISTEDGHGQGTQPPK